MYQAMHCIQVGPKTTHSPCQVLACVCSVPMTAGGMESLENAESSIF